MNEFFGYRTVLGLGALLLASGCQNSQISAQSSTPTTGPSIALSTPAIEFVVKSLEMVGLGDAIARSICESRPVHFKGIGIGNYARIALRLQGDQLGDFLSPPPTGNDRSVLIFDVPVRADGSFEATYTFTQKLGPLTEGGTMTLGANRQLGQLVQVVESFGQPQTGSFRTIVLPSQTCETLLPVPPATWRLGPVDRCLSRSEQLRVLGSGLIGNQARIRVIQFGTTLTRRPLPFKDLGFVPISSDGKVDHSIALDDFPDGDYLLTLFDDNDSRRSQAPGMELNFTVCSGPSVTKTNSR